MAGVFAVCKAEAAKLFTQMTAALAKPVGTSAPAFSLGAANAEEKKALPGSIVKLKSGGFQAVPLVRAATFGSGGAEIFGAK